MSQLTNQQRQAIEAAILGGKKIEAIQRHREATGLGLAEAKQAVEALEASLREQSPERFTGPRKSGCLGVVLLLVGVVLVMMLLRQI